MSIGTSLHGNLVIERVGRMILLILHAQLTLFNGIRLLNHHHPGRLYTPIVLLLHVMLDRVQMVLIYLRLISRCLWLLQMSQLRSRRALLIGLSLHVRVITVGALALVKILALWRCPLTITVLGVFFLNLHLDLEVRALVDMATSLWRYKNGFLTRWSPCFTRRLNSVLRLLLL